VIDDTGFIPKYVKMSAELLAPECGYCLFVSSISAYAGFTRPNDEHSPTGVLADLNTEEITDTSYGPMKALCEQYTRTAFKGRACIVRPVGHCALERAIRFTYWPVRASKGGEMLAPGTPGIRSRSSTCATLASWMMQLVVHRTRGYFNAVSAPRALTMGDLITASVQASPEAHTSVTWVPEDFLAAHWKAEELDLQPWVPVKGAEAAASLTSNAEAQLTALTCRPLGSHGARHARLVPVAPGGAPGQAARRARPAERGRHAARLASQPRRVSRGSACGVLASMRLASRRRPA
jgi:2'-hydroxyisoflavone reductase